MDVTANQDDISNHETFQLEFDQSTKRWYIRTMQDRYWTLESGGGIQAAGDKKCVTFVLCCCALSARLGARLSAACRELEPTGKTSPNFGAQISKINANRTQIFTN